MARDPALTRIPLFAGLPDDELDALSERMTSRQFAAGEELCRAGDESNRAWVITAGMVQWFAPTTAGAGEIGMRLRRGSVIGAQDVVTGELRSATVVATLPTSTLEISADDFIDLASRYPEILVNVIRMQRERLHLTSVQTAAVEERGEEIALIAGPALRDALGPLAAAARSATPRPVTFLDERLSFAGTLTASDQAATEHATVLMAGDLHPERLAALLGEVDRVVALVGSADEAASVAHVAADAPPGRLEIVLVGDEAEAGSQAWPVGALDLVVRICSRRAGYPLADVDVAWLARHLTRTKLGIALGAGGAPGFAHVGVLQVLEEAGYTIDYVGGSSIGGFIASQVGLGYNASEIDARFRHAFNPDRVAELFGKASPLGVGAQGVEVLTGLLKEITEDRWFTHAVIPLVILALDLTERAPAPIRQGALWEALLSALAVAGVFPAQEKGDHRYVDAIALVPVPTASVIEDGADLVLSVNLLGAEKLERWPGPAVDVEEPKKRRRGPLDTLFEVMDLSQLDTSMRHAALADVVVTPRFAPADWRDFQLADLFLAAGRAAAEEQLSLLQSLSRPVDVEAAHRDAGIATSA